MQRLGLVTLLLLGGAMNAHADIHTNMTRHPRTDDALQADTCYCSRETGRAAERHGDLAGLQALHVRPRLALWPYVA